MLQCKATHAKIHKQHKLDLVVGEREREEGGREREREEKEGGRKRERYIERKGSGSGKGKYDQTHCRKVSKIN